jgi:hypothetical protein
MAGHRPAIFLINVGCDESHMVDNHLLSIFGLRFLLGKQVIWNLSQHENFFLFFSGLDLLPPQEEEEPRNTDG